MCVWLLRAVVAVELFDVAVGARRINVQEKRKINHHSEGQEEDFNRHTHTHKYNHAQHRQQTAVQVILHTHNNIILPYDQYDINTNVNDHLY